MKQENLHRLLKRQIKKSQFSDEEIEKMSSFFEMVNSSYKRADDDREHLEHILELSSQELFSANQKLTQDVEFKTKEVTEARIQLNRVVDNVKEIIFQADLSGNFIYLNTAWEKITGFKVEETLGKHFTGFFKNVDERDLSTLQDLENIGDEAISRTFRKIRNGETRWFEISIKSTRDQDNIRDGYIGAIVDITSLKKTEEELIKANKVKDNFLSSMSHEIRTPLNAVIGISNVLLMNEPKEEQVENLKALKFSSKHLLNLINDILDFSKLKVGKVLIHKERFDIYNNLASLEKAFSYSAEDKNLKLIFEIDDRIPQFLSGDSLRFSQVVTNLLSNAIKFTSEGEVKLIAQLLSKNDKTVNINFEIVDTGIGIAKENFDKIFERFSQAEDHTAKKYGGTGLGLSISKKLLNLYGSDLNIESDLGKGTTFSFKLEFGKEEICAEQIIQTQQNISNNIKGLKVLVAEDNPMNVLVLRNYFEKWGVEFVVAENGQEIIEKIQVLECDLILMDLQMPILDGYNAATKIRSIKNVKCQEIPIIALSASVSSDVLDKVKACGMNDYLSKPFDPEDLMQKLSHHTSKLVLV